MKNTLKEIIHLYIGCEVRIFNKVTKSWGHWRKLTFSDCNLIVNYENNFAHLKLKKVSNISEEDKEEISKLTEVERTIYLLKNSYDLFDLLETEFAVTE